MLVEAHQANKCKRECAPAPQHFHTHRRSAYGGSCGDPARALGPLQGRAAASVHLCHHQRSTATRTSRCSAQGQGLISQKFSCSLLICTRSPTLQLLLLLLLQLLLLLLLLWMLLEYG